jgi:hypothetical protein
VAVIAAAALTPAPALAFRSAAAPTLSSQTLSSSSTKVVSSKNHKLRVLVSASHSVAGQSGTSVNVTLATRTFSESHGFNFPIAASMLKISKTGKGSLKVGSKLGRYGKISLHFAPYGKATVNRCQGQVTSKSRKVTLSGTFFFDSRSGRHGWGTVGKRSGTFHFSTINTVTWFYVANITGEGCLGTFVPPCSFGTSWSGSYRGTSLSGSAAAISGIRTVPLSRPKGASRFDSVTSSNVAATLKPGSGGTATMSIKGKGGGVKGTASIASTNPGFPEPGTCGRHKTAQTTTFWSGPWKNGSTPLSIKGQIFPAIKVASDPYASFSKVSKG